MLDNNPYEATTEKIPGSKWKWRKRLEMLACVGVSAAIQILGLFWGAEAYNPKLPSMANTVLDVTIAPLVVTQQSIAFLPYSFFLTMLIAMPITWVWVGLSFWVGLLLAKWTIKHLRFYVSLVWDEVAS